MRKDMPKYFKFEVKTSSGVELEPVTAVSLKAAEDIARSNNFGKKHGKLKVKRFKTLTQSQRNKRSADKRKAMNYVKKPILMHVDDEADIREYGEALIYLRGDFE